VKLGILGLPACGKSTLFDLLTECLDGSEYTKSTGTPRVRTVKVRDPRLERLREDYAPKKYTPASLEFLDFPGVAGGSGSSADSRRSGLADLLAPARDLEALIICLRDFDSPGQADPDPARDLAEIRAEFVLADLVVVERRLERLAQKSRKPQFTDDEKKEQEILGGIFEQLEAEMPVSGLDLDADTKRRLSGFGFLSGKPVVLAINRGDGGSGMDPEALAGRVDAEAVFVRALDELEILQLPAEEQQGWLEEYGIEELSRDPLISASYRTAGRISFFTVGDKEVRAWTIREGESAVEAAGEIHTDIQRGFIRAEIVGYGDYVEFGGVKGAREKGVFRLEGKDYVMRDGDIVEFRFSV